MSDKLAIFDFDGTVADSYDLIYRSLCEYTNLHPDKIALKKMPTSQVVNHFNLSKLDLVKMIFKVRREFSHNISYLQTFCGLKESLLKLKRSSIRLVLLTSNSKDNAEKFLTSNEMDGIFNKIYSVKTIFGKSRALNKIKDDHGIPEKNIFYIADETRDIIAAKKSNINIISVSWGYNHKSILSELGPNYLVNRPSDICLPFE